MCLKLGHSNNQQNIYCVYQNINGDCCHSRETVLLCQLLSHDVCWGQWPHSANKTNILGTHNVVVLRVCRYEDLDIYQNTCWLVELDILCWLQNIEPGSECRENVPNSYDAFNDFVATQWGNFHFSNLGKLSIAKETWEMFNNFVRMSVFPADKIHI